MSKTGAFAMSAIALELAAELSGMADNLEMKACSNATAEEIAEEIQYALDSLGALATGYGSQHEDMYDKHIRFTNIIA